MTRRRSFLRTTGVAALGGLTSIAGCLGQGSQATPSTTTSTTSTTTNTTANETTTENEPKQSQPGERFHIGGTTLIDDFEDLGPWNAENGQIEADTETAFKGSQSMHITAKKSDSFAWVTREVDWDLQDKTLSMAFNPRTPMENVIVVVRLIAPDTNNVQKMGELVRGRNNQGWMRLDLATRDFSGSPDLSKVKRVEVGMRAAEGAIDFNIDDLRSVPRPDKGYVVLSFDDSLESHYTEGFKRMQQYDMPGNVGVITGQVGTEGSLTVDEMSEMQDAGWEFASHSTRDTSLTKLSTQDMWLAINDASDWLASNGFSKGNESFVYPHGVYDDQILEFVGKNHSLGFRYMDPLSAASGQITDPLTVGRGNAAYDLKLSKTMVNYAEYLKNITVLTFHDIANDGGLSMSPENFQNLIDYIDQRDVEVITFSDLKQNHLAD